MSFTGDLKKLPLADVFQSIHQNSLSGALAVRDPRGERLISFNEGYVSGCVVPEGMSQDIGEELIRRRVVESKDIGRPSRFFRRKGSLKRSLKRRKILESGEFNNFARTVVLERIYDIFLLEEGNFEFHEEYDTSRFDDDEQSAGVRIAPGEILMEAMRRIDEWKRIRRSIPSFREVYVATRQPQEEDDPLQAEILSLTAAGELDLETVLASLPSGRFTGCEAVLTMVESGDLRVATAPEYLDLGKAAEERGDLDKAAACYARGLHYERGNLQLNERRISVLERLERNQEAADERKLYAGSLLEQGDQRGAAEQYAKAAKLAPGDPLPRERLLDLQTEAKDAEAALKTADDLVALYLRLGLGESAKSVFPRLLMLKPKDRWLRTRMAETHAALHDHPTAARIYRELADELLAEDHNEEAAGLLRKALLLQEDERTQSLLEEVETGTHAVKRRRRRVFTAAMVALGLACLALAWGSYEVMALADLRTATRESLAMLDQGPEGVLGALNRLEATQSAYPWTRAAAWSDELALGLSKLYVREARLSAATFELAPPPVNPPPNQEVMDQINAALKPPIEGAPSLEDLVQRGEAALVAGHQEEALKALVEARARVRDKIVPAMNQASPNLRLYTPFKEAEERVRRLLPRIHMAWGRVSLTRVRELLDAAQAASEAPTPSRSETRAGARPGPSGG